MKKEWPYEPYNSVIPLMRRTLLVWLSLLLVLFLPFAAADANFLNVQTRPFLAPNTTINITAGMLNSTNESDYLGNFMLNCSLGNLMSNSTSNDSAATVLNFTLNATLYGEHRINCTDNSTDSQNKFLTVYVTNVSNATIRFTNTLPPFAAGSSFVVNITLNHSNGSLLTGYLASSLYVRVFQANRNETSGWTIQNLSSATDATGTIQYNITIPSTADGQYALVVERGAGFLVFMVKSSYTMAVSTQDSTGETKVQFAPAETMSVLAKIWDSSNNPVTGATVSAFITLPNGTIVNFSLSAANATAFPGFYNGSYVTPSSPTGAFLVRVKATAGSQNLEGFTQFFTQSFAARLQEETDFFQDWGGFRAIRPGGNVVLNLVVTNLTSGSLIEGYLNAGNTTRVNCTQLERVTLYWAANNTAYNTTNTTYSNATFEGTPVCRLTFTAPSLTGPWLVKVNVTINTTNDTAHGFFFTQNFFLKVKPVQSFGGGDEFFQAFSPGSNVTFDVSAYNLTGQGTVNGSAITVISVRRMRALAFETGGTDQTSVSYWVSYWAQTGGDPRLTVTLPVNTTGPILVEVEATVSGQNVSGNAMVLAKYVEGFIEPQSQGGPGGGPPASACSGVQNFTGKVRDIRTNQNAQGVILNGVKELRDEFTGKDLTGCISTSSAVSGSDGTLTFNATFTNNASCMFSGFYFMILNVTYQGNVDFLPSGFQCKTLDAFASIYVRGQQAWQISPDDSLTINVSQVRLLNGTPVPNGSFVLLRMFNFNPATGPRVLEVAGGASTNTTILGGMGALNVSPSNFTSGGTNLSRWPSGFLEIQLRVCSNSSGSSGTCGTVFTGAQVVAFNAFVPMMGPPATYYPGQYATVNVMAATNVSSNLTGGTNLTGFTVRVGKPWEGQVQTGTINSVALLNDGWNKASDVNFTSFENWTVNFTVPSGLAKGFQAAIVTVNSSAHNDTVDVFFPLSISTYQVVIPFREDVRVFEEGRLFLGPTQVNATWFNLTYLNTTASLNVSSKSGRYCEKPYGLNSSRQGMGPSTPVQYNASWKLLLVDNRTPGIYDTIVVNQTITPGGLITVTNYTNRSFAGNNTIQLWELFDCAFFTILSTVAPPSSNNWGGTHQSGQSFMIPYIVQQAGARVPGATVGVANIILQTDMGGSQGGQGFEGMLTEGVNYTVFQQAVTDANGFGFLNVSINRSGALMLFWNLSAGSNRDTATFESGTFLEVRNFDTFGNEIFWNANRFLYGVNATNASVPCGPGGVNCTLVNTSSGTLNISNNAESLFGWYVGFVNESSGGICVNDSFTSTLYFAWNPQTYQLVFDDDRNFATTEDESTHVYNVSRMGRINETIRFMSNTSTVEMKTGRAFETGSNTSNSTLYQDSPTPSSYGPPNFQPANSTAPLFARVCAQTFSSPPTPLPGVNISFYMQRWTFSGPSQTNLTIVDPLNGAQVSTITAGPSGCAGVSILAPGGGWPNSQGQGPAEIRANVYNGTNMETSWVTMVQFFG